jgi:hypothetical protein
MLKSFLGTCVTKSQASNLGTLWQGCLISATLIAVSIGITAQPSALLSYQPSVHRALIRSFLYAKTDPKRESTHCPSSSTMKAPIGRWIAL